MGLFSTVIHVYKSSQQDVVLELSNELKLSCGFSKFKRIDINNVNYKEIFGSYFYIQPGVYYLITDIKGLWTTVIELNLNDENASYLYEFTNKLSKRLNTYALSFHFHDDDVLLYNLEKDGESLDGYNSDYQYFLTEPADKEEILSQRHTPEAFEALIPLDKNIGTLNAILNEGYWDAFDNNDLDEEGIPNDEKYYIDEQERFVRVGKYIEIFSKDDYPFADWYSNLSKLNLENCYLLRASR